MLTLYTFLGLYLSLGLLIGSIACWVHLYKELDSDAGTIGTMVAALLVMVKVTLTWPVYTYKVFKD